MMSSAAASPQSTIPPSQRRRSLLELSEKLRDLADMQVEPEPDDIESALEFRDFIHQLCQEEPAVAQAIATAIRENIPDLFLCCHDFQLSTNEVLRAYKGVQQAHTDPHSFVSLASLLYPYFFSFIRLPVGLTGSRGIILLVSSRGLV